MSKIAKETYETAWQKLHQYESDLERLITVSKVSNPIVTVVFALNMVLASVAVVCALIPTPIGVEQWPVVSSLLSLCDHLLGEQVWKWIVFCLLMAGVIPGVIGSVAAFFVKRSVKAVTVDVPSLENEKEQEMVEAKLEELSAAGNRVQTSYGLMFLITLACAVGGYVLYYKSMAAAQPPITVFESVVAAVIFLVAALVLWFAGWMGYKVAPSSELEEIRKSLIPSETLAKEERTVAPEMAKPITIVKETEQEKEETVDPEIRRIDPFLWNKSYVAENEQDCRDMTLNYIEIAQEALQERQYEEAAKALDRAAYALALLELLPGGEQYGSYLYANQYAAARVYAFGLKQRAEAMDRLGRAVQNAKKYAQPQYENHERSARDHAVMSGVLQDFQSGMSLNELTRVYGSEFPDDIF